MNSAAECSGEFMRGTPLISRNVIFLQRLTTSGQGPASIAWGHCWWPWHFPHKPWQVEGALLRYTVECLSTKSSLISFSLMHWGYGFREEDHRGESVRLIVSYQLYALPIWLITIDTNLKWGNVCQVSTLISICQVPPTFPLKGWGVSLHLPEGGVRTKIIRNSSTRGIFLFYSIYFFGPMEICFIF